MGEVNYGELYKPDRPVKVIKKDNTREEFNVQKVINAVGKSAYRALTDFTDEEKRTFLGENAMKFYGFKNMEPLKPITNML